MSEPLSQAPAPEPQANAPSVSYSESKPVKERELTLKQKKFVRVTAKTLNPTEGAVQAYNVNGNRDLAHTIASENMRKPLVKKALAKAMSTNKQEKDILQDAFTAERVDKITYGELHRFWKTALELKGKLRSEGAQTTNVGIFLDNSTT